MRVYTDIDTVGGEINFHDVVIALSKAEVHNLYCMAVLSHINTETQKELRADMIAKLRSMIS